MQSHPSLKAFPKAIQATRISRFRWQLDKIEHGLAYVRKFGEDVCPGFTIDDQNRKTIIRLIRYFHGDPAYAPNEKVVGDLTKGILLIGDPGVGKTVLMEIFTRYVAYDEMFFSADGKRCNLKYPIVPVNLAVRNYESGGNDFIELYTRQRIVCFEDLGEEQKEAVYFGSRLNVMQQVLEERYHRNVITLATTNHQIDTLGKMYGGRVHSRLREMFNVMILPGHDRRKDTVKRSVNDQAANRS